MKTTMQTLSGMLMVLFILLLAPQSSIAAPAGELTIVSPIIGNQVPIAWEELSQANDWMKLLYDPLVGTTSDAELSPEAGLAQRWVMSPDGLIWTFSLRKGIKFHDGVEVTAKDAKFTVEKAMGPESKSNIQGSLKDAIKSMEVKDDYTLVVYCKKPYLFLPDGLFSDIGTVSNSIIPKDYYERVGRDKFIKNPIGSGPYKFHSQLVGSIIKLEATDKHWRDGVPRYKYVTFRIIPEESTRIAMLKTGEADIARISRESVKEILGAGLNVITKKNAAIVQFQPNFQYDSPTLSDVRFRKALNLAIDREAIIKHIFGGMASPTTTYPGANISGVRGVPNLKPYPYDPEEAKQLIKEGRFEGVELSVPNIPRAGCPEMSRVIEAVCGYWEKIGVKPKIYNIDYSQFRALRRAKKTVGHLQPTDSVTCKALSEIVQVFRENLFSTMEVTLVKDPKVDQMIERAERSLDRAEVEKIMVELYRYMYDNHVFIPICDIHDEIATNKRVPKWEPGYRRHDRNINDIIRQR
jgi:peptide/nickel transport system substrate-binding protein